MDKARELVSDYFMYFTITIWFSSEVLLYSRLEYILWWKTTDFNSFMGYFCLALLTFQIVFLQHYTTKEFFILAFISIPMVIGTLNSDYHIMISTWLFIVASKYVSFEKVAIISYIVLIVTMSIIVYMFYIGLIDEVTLYRGNYLRHSLGFTHPNWLGIRTFQLVLLHIYLRRHKLSILDYSYVVASIWFVKRVPNCKTAYYALTILLLLLVLRHLMEYFIGGSELFARTLIWVAIAANVMSVALSVINVKGHPVLNAVDKFMSKRFSWCNLTLRYYGLSLFGKDIDLYVRRMGTLVRRLYLDTAYMSILLRYGVVVFVLFSALYIFTMIYLYKTKSYFLILVLCLYAIYGIMENNFFAMNQNIFLIVLAMPIYGKKQSNEAEYLNQRKARIKIA